MFPAYHLVLRLLATGLILFGLGLFSGCPASSPAPEKKAPGKDKPTLSSEALEHLAQGQKFIQDQKLDEALKEFQETVRLAPNSPVAHFWLGRAYFYRQDKEQAEKSFKKVLELDPENYHAMAWLGKMYSFDRDKLELAQNYLLKALEESPENLDAHFDLGRVYAMQGERNKAMREFGFLFSKERDFFIYHFEFGRMLEAWGEPDRAIEHYKRAQTLNPNFPLAAEAIKRLESAKKEGKPSQSPAPAPPAPAPTTPVRR
jgi:tetratricopeptide (TPR) repeat protein